MILKYRSVGITEKDFKNNLTKKVNWEDIRVAHYIACHQSPFSTEIDCISKKEGLYAHDALVTEIEKDRIKILNPGRNEQTDCFLNSFGGYGNCWYLIRPNDYSGPKE